MNVLIWARVSSREQREGYSIDAQLRADRDKAQREGWTVVKEFVIAESAKRGAERTAFNSMLRWLKKNAKREKVDAILSHKLDRVCRNMRDAVRLQELEDTDGVKLAFVENDFAPGPAGALSFNVMAAVAQYYSDNLRTEVLKGIDERVRQGWPCGGAAYGYMNVPANRDEPYQPHPENSKTVIRIFELYSTGKYTFESLTNQLANEGHTYQKSQPRFHRTALSYILNNRIYIGEIKRGDQHFPGKHQPLIDRTTFQLCQDILSGKNKKAAFATHDHPLAGGLFCCEYCGALITGERIRRKLRGGGVREHLYYRCANNHPGADHPRVRWKAADLEQAIVADLESLRLPTREIKDWFRSTLTAAFSEVSKIQGDRAKAMQKRKTELATMQDRLFNAFLAGTVDEKTYNAKLVELRDEAAQIDESLAEIGDSYNTDAEEAIAVFDFSQNAADLWRGSKMIEKREILETLSLNRTLGHLSLDVQKRKPFDILAKRPQIQFSRLSWTPVELFAKGASEMPGDIQRLLQIAA